MYDTKNHGLKQGAQNNIDANVNQIEFDPYYVEGDLNFDSQDMRITNSK